MMAETDDETSRSTAVSTAPRRRLSVLVVASEVAPFRKTGGLADVIGALPKALAARDIDVRVVTPLYAGIPWNDQERLDGALSVPMYYGRGRAAVRLGTLPSSSVPIYFIEHHRYYDRYGGGRCREMRAACMHKEELGEQGMGNCRRYRELCG